MVEVVKLPHKDDEVDKAIIDLLTEALERAKTGEFESIVMVYVTKAQHNGVMASQTNSVTRMLGAMHLAMNTIIQSYDSNTPSVTA